MSDSVTIPAARYAELLEREEHALALVCLLEIEAHAQSAGAVSSNAAPEASAPSRASVIAAMRELRRAFG